MLIINSIITRKMIAFLSYRLKKKNPKHYHSEKKLEDTSSPSKIRDYIRWLSTSITANETSWKFDTDASGWRAEKGQSLHNHLLAQTPKTSHGTNVKRIHIPTTVLQLCFCMFCHGRVGVCQITTRSQEYPRITMPWLRQKRPVCHLIRLAPTVWKLLCVKRYGVNHKRRKMYTVTNTLIAVLSSNECILKCNKRFCLQHHDKILLLTT